MTLPTGPRAWAGQLTLMLNAAMSSADRFPVKVADLARDYTDMVFREDPIRRVEGAALPGFEGALLRIPGGRGGWGIAYNSSIRSLGRINFTLAHELGHYLVHRHQHAQGIYCSEDDVVQAASGIEREADLFAADLLMPFDDYRRQIPARDRADIEILSACAERYGVSLLAASLRWLDYTERRAVLAVSRDGYLLWAKSSAAARRTGAFVRTSGEPVALPESSLAARQDLSFDNRAGTSLPPGVWFPEQVKEMTVFSEQYDLVISLLELGDAEPRWRPLDDGDEDAVAVPVDKWLR